MSKNFPMIGAALAYSQQQLGGLVTQINNVIAVSTSPLTVAQNNGDRVGLVFLNLGAGSIYIALDNGVSANRGILLAPNGGNAAMNVRDDFTLPAAEWDAICPSGGPSNLYVIELIRIVSPGAPQQ